MADVGFFLSTSHLCNLPPFEKGGLRGIFFKGEATNHYFILIRKGDICHGNRKNQSQGVEL
jgi:hypothetical protein